MTKGVGVKDQEEEVAWDSKVRHNYEADIFMRFQKTIN